MGRALVLAAVCCMAVCVNAQCHGLDFNVQPCGLPTETYALAQGVCYQGSVAVSSPHGSFVYQSTSVSCLNPNSCAWNCYADANCATAVQECAAGYSALTCSCTNINFSWDIKLAGTRVNSWQGNVTAAKVPLPHVVADGRAGRMPVVPLVTKQ
eukprot:TRINITY_DN21533_c0_g1_i1.p1 TRINITY_DN21533_c0_g1~~TRINITY_DN21533_c0_g1_i1.p1  ORF type:complete len:170 (+),score=24.37 TRINITY_DN21533_c0_g1_i1:51-512(+)